MPKEKGGGGREVVASTVLTHFLRKPYEEKQLEIEKKYGTHHSCDMREMTRREGRPWEIFVRFRNLIADD